MMILRMTTILLRSGVLSCMSRKPPLPAPLLTLDISVRWVFIVWFMELIENIKYNGKHSISVYLTNRRHAHSI